MTKWQRFVSNRKITRILLSLIFLALLKLTVFGLIGVDSLTLKVVETVMPDVVPATASAAQANATSNDVVAQTAPDMGNTTVDTPAEMTPAQQEMAKPRTEMALPEQWKALKKKEERLAAKERDLVQLESDIKAEAERVSKLHAEIRAMLDEAKNLKDERVKQVVDIIANTKSKKAAQIIENLDEDLAVKVLAGMRGRQAGEILTFVESKKAAALSKALTEIQIPFQN